MLKYIEKIEPATADATIICGRDISRSTFLERQRDQLAIDVIEGRAIITDLSKKQIARVFCVPASYFPLPRVSERLARAR
jgi:hypothetical protein